MENCVYKIYNEKTNKVVAYIEYNHSTDTYKSKIYKGYEEIDLFSEFDGYRMVAGAKKNPTSKEIEGWLKDRAVPEDRQGIAPILHKFGITEYDWRTLIRFNDGRVWDDNIKIIAIGGLPESEIEKIKKAKKFLKECKQK